MPGLYESAQIVDQTTAQQYYEYREITERKLRGATETSYSKDYKKWKIPTPTRPISAPIPQTFGKTGPTSYQQDFPHRYNGPPELFGPEPAPKSTAKLQNYTTNSVDYQHPGPAQKKYAKPPALKDMGYRPFNAETSYGKDYKPKGPNRSQRAKGPVELPSPAFQGRSTYQQEYYEKPTGPGYQKPAQPKAGKSMPFRATTTHADHFRGWQLPEKRYNLGVETVGDVYHVMIPKSQSRPAQATHIFSTHRNSQENGCILVLEGDNPIASKNKLLGQFDMTKIPPAPRQVPAIEVTFNVDADDNLTVEGRNLDVGHHKIWTKRGGATNAKK